MRSFWFFFWKKGVSVLLSKTFSSLFHALATLRRRENQAKQLPTRQCRLPFRKLLRRSSSWIGRSRRGKLLKLRWTSYRSNSKRNSTKPRSTICTDVSGKSKPNCCYRLSRTTATTLSTSVPYRYLRPRRGCFMREQREQLLQSPALRERIAQRRGRSSRMMKRTSKARA